MRLGLGLRKEHFPYLEQRPSTQVDWFEAITENYLDSAGRPRQMLELIRADYPVALHGVSLSLARPGPLDLSYLKKLKLLVQEIQPFVVSDHLCFTGLPGSNLHNLLPFVYDQAHLRLVSEHVDFVQNFLGRKILVENLSAYFIFKDSVMNEAEFLRALCQQTGCGVLLDLNNVYVNSHNFGFDPLDFIQQIPRQMVGQVHLAGYTDLGDFYFDTHSRPVSQEVWKLFEFFTQTAPDVATMVEWDDELPSFEELEAQIVYAKTLCPSAGEAHV